MYIAECSALATALCWSFGGLLATTPTRALGPLRFNRIRLTLVSLLLVFAALATGGFHSLDLHSALILTASAMIGIFVGDNMLYATLKRLGPRRTGILFTTNAPITVILGLFFLGETPPWATAAGCVLIVLGVFLAVFCGTTSPQKHAFEQVQGSLGWGLVLGFSSALCQSISVLIARPVMAAGVDAIAASALRVGTAALALHLFMLILPHKTEQPVPSASLKIFCQIGLSGLVGLALGMTFLLYALAHGPAGMVSTLSATSPILILPILWMATGERPAPGAWLGACLAVLGIACIFNPWAAH